MNTRELTLYEQSNLTAIKDAVGDYVLLFLTANGLDKSILDATLPFRTLLKDHNIHDFKNQYKGGDHKVFIEGNIVEDTSITPIKISFYRPTTKDGDPRFWPYNFKKFSNPDDIFIIFVANNKLHFINLTKSSLAEDIKSKRVISNISNPETAYDFINSLSNKNKAVAEELLSILRSIAQKGPLEAVCKGDTAIGRSIETAINIKQNSNKAPDYKGIEIKSSRGSERSGKLTLFTKTPDWERSFVKNSKDYLDLCGYARPNKEGKHLYCSVYSNKYNPNRLKLSLNIESNDLEEFYENFSNGPIAVWDLDTLHKSFREKHNETFHISADTQINSAGKECFILKSVLHTKKALIPQFDQFLSDGRICLDHTIFTKNGSVKDKGYSFRIAKTWVPDLFTGSPQRYDLS